MNRRRLPVVLILTTVVGAAIWYRWGSTGTVAYSEEVVAGGLHLRLPIRIDKWGTYLDGGSCGGVFRDAWNRRSEFAFRYSYPEDLRGQHGPGRLEVFIGADHYRDPGAIEIPPNSRAEADLLAAIDGWLDSKLDASTQAAWLAVTGVPPDTMTFMGANLDTYQLLRFARALKERQTGGSS